MAAVIAFMGTYLVVCRMLAMSFFPMFTLLNSAF